MTKKVTIQIPDDMDHRDFIFLMSDAMPDFQNIRREGYVEVRYSEMDEEYRERKQKQVNQRREWAAFIHSNIWESEIEEDCQEWNSIESED